ncbi:MAG: ABC transporter ATP-binding protein [Candidatus Fermentibacteraceae bacterium]|nr:ABC transporter ATP-binding protein [Candidatus Fermentibacteraceae bacterium]
MNKEPLIQVSNLSKSYRKVQALREFSLEVNPGMIFSLLGPNGAGKTTLMKILLRIVKCDSGSVHISSIPVSSPLSRRGVRYLPENVTFPSWATPKVLLRQLERIRHESSMQDFILRCTELDCIDLINRPMGKMSRGQRQRVALSLVTTRQPDLVLLDEPSTGLDPGGRVLIRNLIKNLASNGSTILINSHLLGEVERVCDMAAFIDKGRLIAEGALDSLSRQTGLAFVETEQTADMCKALENAGYSCQVEDKGILVQLTAPSAFREFTETVLATEIFFSALNLKRENLEDVFLRIMEHSNLEDDIVS